MNAAIEFDFERMVAPSPDMLLALERFDREAMGGGAAGRYTLRAVADYGWLFVARAGGEIAACAQVLRHADDPAAAHLFGFFTVERFRRVGAGRALLLATLDALAAAGVTRIDLTVDPGNEAAIRLYERCGFRVERRSTDHYGPGEARLVLVRTIAREARS